MLGQTIQLPALKRRLFALLGALVLAAAGLQALAPIAAPLERSQGSAFSASTGDVAVVSQRSAAVLRAAPLPLPPLPEPPLLARPGRDPLADTTLTPPSTGPPINPGRGFPPTPRGPPHS